MLKATTARIARKANAHFRIFIKVLLGIFFEGSG
jgi:hypothetical protein